jgi:hypothetical protein
MTDQRRNRLRSIMLMACGRRREPRRTFGVFSSSETAASPALVVGTVGGYSQLCSDSSNLSALTVQRSLDQTVGIPRNLKRTVTAGIVGTHNAGAGGSI